MVCLYLARWERRSDDGERWNEEGFGFMLIIYQHRSLWFCLLLFTELQGRGPLHLGLHTTQGT